MKGKILFGVIAAILIFVPAATGERPDEVKSIRSDRVSHYEMLDKVSVPSLINYQGYLTDVWGNAITDTLEMGFSIWDAATGGSQLWSETQSSVVVANGLFNVLLGGVTPIPSTVFTGAPLWLQTQVGTEILQPRKEIVSVGYAVRAAVADAADYADEAIYADTTDFAWTTETAIYADTSDYADSADVAGYAYDANWADSSNYAVYADSADVAGYAHDGTHADTADYASYADSAGVIGPVAYADSAGVAGYARDADMLDGQHASDFLSTANDWGRSGVATDLYEETTKLTDKYVNEGQANSITSGMIVDGTIKQADLSFTIPDGHSLDAVDGNPTDALYVDNNGRIGIGTANPAHRLHTVDASTGLVQTVYGESHGIVGGSAGVYGYSPVTGVSGVYGVYGKNDDAGVGIGGYAGGTGKGVEGYSSAGRGGEFFSGGDVGLYGWTQTSANLGNKAVYGYAARSDGLNYAVYGETNSPDGYAGYFEGGRNYFEGNVGIGTTSPDQQLDVAGTVEMTGFKMPTDASDGYVLTSDASGVGTWQPTPGGIGGSGTANYVPKFTDPSTLGNSEIYETGGNVGIGTTSPMNKLHVNGEIIADGDDFALRDGAHRYRLQYGGSGIFNIKQVYDAGNTLTNAVRLSIANNGNVGIGTTTPTTRLDIAGECISDVDVIYGTGDKLSLASYDRGGNTNSYISFHTADGSSTGERVRIDSSGNVGIGTTDPSTKLHIEGGIDAGLTTHGFLVLGPVTGQNIVIDQNEIMARDNGATSPLYIQHNGGNTLLNWGGGNVGIGTTSPNYKLDVAGDINTTGDVRKNGTAYNNPDYVFKPGYNLMSLKDLKEFIIEKKHLPNMPSTDEIRKEGVKIFEQNRLLLEKLEEAYLYIIQLEERIGKLEEAIAEKYQVSQ